MGDAPAASTEAQVPAPVADVQLELEQRPFGGLEFQVSEVVGRLEASVNGQYEEQEEESREPRKISAGFFEPEASTMSVIMKSLEELVHNSDPSCDSGEPPLLPTDAVARAAIMSHSIAALLSKLERSHAARLGAHIASETTRWMAHIFRLTDYNAYYHQEQLEGLVKVTRMLLHHRYPRYLEDGALAFTSRTPCIYSSVASPLGVVQHLCRQLGLPLACVRPVPVHPSGRGMDITALDRLISEDVELSRAPLLVLGEAGAPPLGCGSSLRELQAVCNARQVYLHVSGHSLALPAVVGRSQIFNVADSLTLTPGPWFGVPGLPTVTFYRIPEPITANDITKVVNSVVSREGTLAGLSGLGGGAARLPALPLWAALRAAGAAAIFTRLARAYRSARTFYDIVKNSELRILSEKPGGDDPANADVVESVSQCSSCVTFGLWTGADNARPPPYYDKLTSWLGQVLQREADMINIEVCETEAHGIVLRYCPLEGAILDESRTEELQTILDSQLHVVRATLELREPFQKSVESRSTLRLVLVPGWAGLGGVRYVPEGWDQASPHDLNVLNKDLVETLRATDGAFSCGDADDGMACIRFGMVTADTDVEELLDLVQQAGKEVEESSKTLSTMSEVLKKGILEAEAELSRERAARWGAGVLALVPGAGRVAGWWAAPALGRSLHLAEGSVRPTTYIYSSVQKKHEDEPARAHSPARQAQTDQ